MHVPWKYLQCWYQMPYFKAKMHQIRFRLRLRPRSNPLRSSQRSTNPLMDFNLGGPTSKGREGRERAGNLERRKEGDDKEVKGCRGEERLSLSPITSLTPKFQILKNTLLGNAPYIWVPWKFSGLPDYVHGYFSQDFMGFGSDGTAWTSVGEFL